MVTDNSKVSNEARNARRLDPRPTAFEAAQLIKPPALRGVSDFVGKELECQNHRMFDGKMSVGLFRPLRQRQTEGEQERLRSCVHRSNWDESSE
jgi:hypothetical protein